MQPNATPDSPSPIPGAIPAAYPDNEEQRIHKLLSYCVLDTASESAYDDIAAIATQICDTQTAVVSLVDGLRQWFKATVGLEATETPRDIAFCAHAILQPEVMVIPDARADSRFANNPLVTGAPFIRFYAGAPLITPDGYALGTLCVIDQQPKELTDTQIQALEALARQVVSQLETRLMLQKVKAEVEARKAAEAKLNQLNATLERRVQDKTKTLIHKNQQLAQALHELKEAQAHLVQAEKMSSLGQLVAGVAHEINNPVNFIAGNLTHVKGYAFDLLSLIALYEQSYPQSILAIEAEAKRIDLPFVQQDFPKLISSMESGTDRICQIVLSLRNFSRMDEAACKVVDIHEGIDSTLLILQHRLDNQPGQPSIELIKEYGDLPAVECYAGALNQVFMNILANAIDALEKVSVEKPQPETAPAKIRIRTTALEPGWVEIAISDNGPGMTPAVIDQVFNPFFTTKPIGKGTGIGLSISYQIIVDKHQGKLECRSQSGKGTEFLIQIPSCLHISNPELSAY